MKHLSCILITALALAAMVATACTPVSKGTRGDAPRRASESKPYDFKSEGDIPPPPRGVEEAADVEETPVREPDLEVEEAEPPAPPPAEAATPDAVRIDGYRIQVFASASPDVAEGARRTAQARTGKSAYVTHEDGLYKVRIGNCRTRADAEKLLEKVRSGYYADAWIVETKIEVPMGTEGD
jgi:cell division protein FtsN